MKFIYLNVAASSEQLYVIVPQQCISLGLQTVCIILEDSYAKSTLSSQLF